MLLLLFVANTVSGGANPSKLLSEIFIENKGQVKDENGRPKENVLFYSQGGQMQLFITTSGYSVVTALSTNKGTTYNKIDFALEGASILKNNLIYVKDNSATLNFYNAGSQLENVCGTKMVIIRNVYPGIDWAWSFDKDKNPKHEFMVNIGAEASVIRYSVVGANTEVSDRNNLIYTSREIKLKEGPILLQHTSKDYEAQILFKGNSISYQIPEALSGGGFTIDPPLQLLWGAVLDTLETSFKGITPDIGLNTISAGYSSFFGVPTFPQVNGSYVVSTAKNKDVVIMKTDPNQNLIWATFFGGSGNDEATAITSSPTGIFITGYSESWDFPQAVSGNYTKPVQLFGRDAFIIKFNDLGKWKWGTGYGGNKSDEGMDIKYYNGNIYVAGYTKSNDFPVLAKLGAYNYQDTSLNNYDGFLLEFDTLGNRKWATCIGGSANDYFTSVFVDVSGIYTTGYSDTIAATPIPLVNSIGAYFQSTAQLTESFINRFSPAGALTYSSFFGGSGNEYASCILRNNCGVFVCGKTEGGSLPVLSQNNGNYYQPSNAGRTDGFMAKFDANTLQQLYTTFYGTDSNDVFTKMSSDTSCNVITTGYTNGEITKVGSPYQFFIQDSTMGGYDGLMWAIDSNQIPFWATPFGSPENDFGYSLWFPFPYMVDMVGEGFYSYGKYRIGGTYVNSLCTNINSCPQVTSNGVSNRFFNVLPGGGICAISNNCFVPLQFQALIPTKNTCPNQCNGEARIDTANIGGCPPYQLLWSSGNYGIQDNSLCELYWSKVIDAGGQARTIYGRFDILRVLSADVAHTYCSTAVPYWDSLIHITGGGPPYNIIYRGDTGTCPAQAFFDIVDTAGCIVSYSLPWYKDNLDVEINLKLYGCTLQADEVVPQGVCVNIPAGTQIVINDGIDTFKIPYVYKQSGATQLGIPIQPGNYYSGYLDLPDCIIPVKGVYYMNSIQDSIAKTLACNANSGSISVVIQSDTLAVNYLNGYDAYISITANTTGGSQFGSVTFLDSSAKSYIFNNLPADVYLVRIWTSNTVCDTAYTVVDLRTSFFNLNSPSTYCGVTDTIVATISGGFAPFTYNWSPSLSNDSLLFINSAGTYWLTVTDNQGCISSNSVQVPGSPALQITQLNENTSPCSPGLFSSASVSAVGGTQPYSYVWSSGESSSSANFLPQGTNWIRISDTHGCIAADTFENTKKLQVNVSEIITDPSCFGYSNGSVSLTPHDGYPGYTYSWAIGGNTSLLNSLIAGNYQYTVTDSKGCEISGFAELTDPDSIQYFSFVFDATCTANDGFADINVVGGSGSISIIWEDSNSNFTRFDLDSGIHTFQLTDQNGCHQDGVVDVDVYTPPVNINILTTDVSCFGNNDGIAIVTLNDPHTPITYTWDNGESGSTVTNFYYGSYSVEIIDSIGCVYYESTFINQPDELYIYTIQTSEASCQAADGYASVSVSGGTQPYSAVWDDGGTGLSRNNLTSGTHSFTITDFNGCQQTDAVTILQDNPMSVTLNQTDVSCFGGTDGYADVAVVNALTPISYNWSAGSQLDFQDNLVSGNYTVEVTDNRGCFEYISFYISEPSQLVALVDTGTGILCYGETVSVDVDGAGGTYPYSNTAVYTLGVGTYSYTIIDNNGCTANTSFTLFQPDSVVATVLVDQPTCTNGGGTVDVTVSGGNGPYEIWYASVFQGIVAGGISLTPVTGFHSVQVFDSHGCEVNLDALVDALVQPSGNVSSSSNPLCAGDSNGTVSLLMNQGVSPFTVNGLSFNNSIIIQNLSAGNYTYVITDASGCNDTIDFTLFDPSPLNAGYIVVQDFICSNDSAIVSLYATGGTGTYTGTGSFTLAAGNHHFDVADSNGCVTPVDFTLIAPEPFTLTTAVLQPSCNNPGTVTFYATGGEGPYILQNGTQTIPFSDSTVLTLLPGSYTYTVVDNLGCIKSASFTLNPYSNLSGTVQVYGVHCNGASTGSASLTVTGGTKPYKVNGINFTNSILIPNLASGSYNFIVTDSNGCTLTLFGIITQPPALVIDSISILSGITCTGRSDASVRIIAHGGTPNYVYSLTNSSGITTTHSGSTFNFLGAGIYTAVAIDSFGCSDTFFVEIDTFRHSQHRIEIDSITCHGQKTGAIKLYSEPPDRNPFFYSLNYGTPQEYNVFYELGAGHYQIVINDKANCPDTLYVILNEPDAIDTSVWLNGALLPIDSMPLYERLFAEFTKQNLNPWEIELSPDLMRLINSDTLVKVQPREDITFTVTVYQDSFNKNCFIQYRGLIQVTNVPELPNILTPNGDGFNDVWKIDLDKFPNPSVTIFDRWGEIIFETINYTNNWDGTYRGKYVADGTYFYILKVPSQGNRIYKGDINVLNSTN